MDVHIFLSWTSGSFGKRLSPVNLATCSLNPDLLQLVVRLMISAKNSNLVSGINTHHGPGVSHVDDVDHFVDNHDNISTRPRALRAHILAVHHVESPGMCLLDQPQEASFALPKPFFDSFDGILRKLVVLHHEVVEVVSEVVCTGRTAVAVEDSKETDLGPVNLKMTLVLRLEDVQDDADSVLVVVADDALVGVCCIRFYDSAFLLARLCGLVVLQVDRLGIKLDWVVTEKQRLNFNELNIRVLDVLVRWWCWHSDLRAVVVLLRWATLTVSRGGERVVDWGGNRPSFTLKHGNTTTRWPCARTRGSNLGRRESLAVSSRRV